jgi:hypothetical protein
MVRLDHKTSHRMLFFNKVIETKRFRCPRALDFDTASGLLNRRALACYDVSFGNWYYSASFDQCESTPHIADGQNRSPVGTSFSFCDSRVAYTCFSFQCPCRKRKPIKVACKSQPRDRASQMPPAPRPADRERR